MSPVGRLLKRVLKAVAAFVAFLVYLWIAAVRGVPAAKRRRAAKRAARQVE